MPLTHLLDEYGIRARVFPAAVAALAPALALASWLPFLQQSAAAAAMVGVGGAAVVGAVLAHLVGVSGKNVERSLWSSWGGSPTTQLLRRGNTSLDEKRRAHYHNLLGRLFPDTPPPTVEEEQRDPEGAGHQWDLITERLRSRTRDKTTFSHLFSENCQYGAWRNLYAVRRISAVLAVAALLAAAGRVAYVSSVRHRVQSEMATEKPKAPAGGAKDSPDTRTADQAKGLDDFATAACAGSLLLAGFFLLWLRPSLVKVAAFRYAHRLLESTEILLQQEKGAASKAP